LYKSNELKILRILKGRWFDMPLKNNLKEYRAKLGVNQQEMGKLVGTSRQTISQIERGDYSPSVTLALKIAKVCNVSVEAVFQYD
jgi:putative transcriptional regulator